MDFPVLRVLALVALATLRAEPTPPRGDWPLFRSNSLQTGVATSSLPEALAVRWKFETKEAVEGTAAIVGDTVYVGSFDGNLYALELSTGRKKRAYRAGPIKAPVSVHDGAVFVGDADGTFHCVDAATGQKRWIFKTDSEIASGANFTADAVLFGSGDEHLYCLDLKSGKQRWKYNVAGGPVLGTPVVTGERTFAAGCDSTLHVLDLAQGKELASVELGGQVAASAAVSGEVLHVGTMANQFLAVDWKKGQVLWRFEAARRSQAFFASAAVTDKLVVAGSRDKRVYGLDRKTGQEIWSFLTDGRVDSSPVVAGNRVCVGSQDGCLYLLDLTTGRAVQKINLDGPVSASPAVGGRCLVIGTQKGTVYCLGAK
jgi:outer membrane protein assembly factor BamB